MPTPPAQEGDEADAAPRVGLCDDGDVGLSFEPTIIGRCVPEPEQNVDVPDDGQWRIDTDDVVLQSDQEGSSPPELISTRVIDQDDGSEILVVTVEYLRVGGGAVLYARGTRPLAIVATERIEVRPQGLLTAGGFRTARGAGADDEHCRSVDGRGEDGELQEFQGDDGGTGGGGGGHATEGGRGAAVNESGGGRRAGGAENGAGEDVPEVLRGGCSGGDGGSVSGDDGGGGGAGGALQLVADGTIVIEGAASASGGGGRAGDDRGGGGGGGAGGTILVEAPVIRISGALTANGGGGGQGIRRRSECFRARDGENGERFRDEPAQGGSSGCATAGSGGDGAAATSPAQDGEEGDSAHDGGFGERPAPAGGGGGGGGMGRTWIRYCDILEHDEAVRSPEVITAVFACDAD